MKKVKREIKYNKEGKQLFDFSALMSHEINREKFIVTEVNKPNLDRMAEAFYKLLRK